MMRITWGAAGDAEGVVAAGDADGMTPGSLAACFGVAPQPTRMRHKNRAANIAFNGISLILGIVDRLAQDLDCKGGINRVRCSN